VNSTAVPDNEWQRIWLSIRNHSWSSLALVPPDSSLDVTMVAETLAVIGRLESDHGVTVINAAGVQLSSVQQVVDSITAAVARGERVIVPVDSFADNPSSIAIAQATSAALLVLRLGESGFRVARQALDAVGRERFLGSVVLDGGLKPVHR
jgi:hypothetical protein